MERRRVFLKQLAGSSLFFASTIRGQSPSPKTVGEPLNAVICNIAAVQERSLYCVTKEGNPLTLQVGDLTIIRKRERDVVRDLRQLAVGDKVTATYDLDRLKRPVLRNVWINNISVDGRVSKLLANGFELQEYNYKRDTPTGRVFQVVVDADTAVRSQGLSIAPGVFLRVIGVDSRSGTISAETLLR